MKKRVIFIVLIFIFVLVVAAGCSKQNKIEELKIGKYVMQDTEIEDWAWV